MAQKLMIMPSARTKFVKDDKMRIILYSLLVVALFMVVSNYYVFSFMHAIKLVIMILLSIIVTKETEILFYTMDKGINRGQAKELIAKSYPVQTALIYVLLIPLGTPIWLVVIGAIMATFFGKLMFGGYHHMVFHTSLVGYLFVTLGWTGLAVGPDFVNSFDNWIFDFIFNNNFFNETLSIGNVYDPGLSESALAAIANGSGYDLGDVIFGIVPGIVGNGIVLIPIFFYLIFKKAINWITPTVLLSTFFVTALIIGLVNGDGLEFPVYQLFSGALLFVVIFASTDPITTPIPLPGKIIFGIIAGALAMFIRNGDTYEEGIIFAVLFMSMLTPLLNTELKKKSKVKKDLMPKKKAGV